MPVSVPTIVACMWQVKHSKWIMAVSLAELLTRWTVLAVLCGGMHIEILLVVGAVDCVYLLLRLAAYTEVMDRMTASVHTFELVRCPSCGHLPTVHNSGPH